MQDATATAADVLAGRARWACDRGDCLTWLRGLPADSVHCVVTSPPYFGLRDYGCDGQIGLENTPAGYVSRLVDVFREVRRVLRPDGTCWLNLGDSYFAHGAGAAGKELAYQRDTIVDRKARRTPGFKPKDRLMIPARVAIALQDDGWYLRDEIVWSKPAPMPSSVRDRTCAAHEMVYLLTKRPRYFFDQEAIAEPSVAGHGSGNGFKRDARLTYQNGDGSARGNEHKWEASPDATRVKRSVWRVAASPCKAAHFATMPIRLVEPCVLAGTSARGVCPDCGAPWVRETTKRREATRPNLTTKTTGDRLTDGNRDPERHVTRTVTTGWAASCGCGATALAPAVVLDPFAGSGTTLMVANLLGRRAVGCDLNPDYLGIVADRMAGAMFGAGIPAKPTRKPPRPATLPDLFAHV